MTTRTTASLKSLVKYLLWTAVAAAITAIINELPKVELPIWIIPLLASVLKGAATWAATQAKE